jgi:hypothetical protein
MAQSALVGCVGSGDLEAMFEAGTDGLLSVGW